MGQLLRGLALGAVCVFAWSCSDDAGGPKRACPSEGLGVKTLGGASCVGLESNQQMEITECRDQLSLWSHYSCDLPQIVSDRGTKSVGGPYAIPASPGNPVGAVFLVANASTGKRDLVIDRVAILGDPRCAYRFDLARDLERKTIPPGESAVLRLVYDPPAPGTDTAGVRVFSNAQNYPKLDLWVCGMAGAAPGVDAGPRDLGPVWEASVGGVPCNDPGENIAPCHK